MREGRREETSRSLTRVRAEDSKFRTSVAPLSFLPSRTQHLLFGLGYSLCSPPPFPEPHLRGNLSPPSSRPNSSSYQGQGQLAGTQLLPCSFPTLLLAQGVAWLHMGTQQSLSTGGLPLPSKPFLGCVLLLPSPQDLSQWSPRLLSVPWLVCSTPTSTLFGTPQPVPQPGGFLVTYSPSYFSSASLGPTQNIAQCMFVE